ncbi:trans-2-enoyl-CoA reductase (NADPH) TSC13 ASCRUDRAFT_78013 [Ascoidea rubescens DSM 1968]|uniref:3-oxo-5-alpha-steroid 4-dehydrogenase C-terminal domain-containing protein n=1 Tax=Ascoidea rubescens DSM 1968 TaxID=1344418 RepID=A0A1D2V9H1_9ASCO|nr:hypothetical protein ASCRUDRAFT_78013 [Ascoidea rubescens DSM 1968]ODV58321.1 hypothetical protein ASCRUDRAFT_78013 [Ascoidea rubescens DSM 1968]
MVAIVIRPRSKNLKEFKTSLDYNTPVNSLIEQIASFNNISSSRLRLTFASPVYTKTKIVKQSPLNGDYSLSEQKDKFFKEFIDSNSNELTLFVKDLGPQIAWKTVFILEYLGPLLIHPFFYYLSHSSYFLNYNGFLTIFKIENHSNIQKISLILVLLHFLKREFETIFVHKFSLSTMPLFNLFKNSGHYWILSGFNLSIFIYFNNFLNPDNSLLNFLFYTKADYENNLIPGVLILGWLFAEISNLICHLNLSSLRKDGSKDHKIPFGYGFNLVSCPNYFFESISWLFFFLINLNPFSLFFLVVSTAQMVIWGIKKHKRYLKDFGDKYPRNRKIYFPYIF